MLIVKQLMLRQGERESQRARVCVRENARERARERESERERDPGLSACSKALFWAIKWRRIFEP